MKKNSIEIILVKILILASIIVLPINSFAETELEKLTAENERLTLEKAKITLEKEIAEAKAKLAEAEGLSAAKLAKDIAEAQKAEYAAKIPATKTEALNGTVTLTTIGNIGAITGIRSLNEVAIELCNVIKEKEPKKVMIYEPTLIAGIVSARQLEGSIANISDALDVSLILLPEIEQENSENHLMSLPLAIGAASGTLKALADLASIFKTDLTVTVAAVSEPKALFLTSLGSHCKDNISNIGFGYKGELDVRKYNELLKKVITLTERNTQLHLGIVALKSKMDKDKVFEKKNEDVYNKLVSLAATVDEFIKKLKPEDLSNTSPMSIAASFLQLDELSKTSDILDVDVKIDAMTILKSNIFTGQSVRVSTSSIIMYRLLNHDGKLLKTDTITQITKPIKINLRDSDKADSQFYLKQNSSIVQQEPKK